MFKNFRVILRITPRDIKNFIKAAGRFIRNLLPALVFSSILLLNSSVEVFASGQIVGTGDGLVVEKNPTVSLTPSVAQWVLKYSLELGDNINEDFLILQQGALFWFFNVLVNDTYGASSSTFNVLGSSYSVSPHPVRAVSDGKNLDKFDDDYFHTYYTFISAHYMSNVSKRTDPSCVDFVKNYFYSLTNRKPNSLATFPCSFSDIFFYACDPGSHYITTDFMFIPANEPYVKKYFDYLYAAYLKENGLSGISVGYDNINDIDNYYKDPVVSAPDFKDFIQTNNYNKNAIKVSFREELSKNPNVNSQSFVKLYTDGVSCVGTNMNDGVYLLRYVYRDGKYYFSPYQYYFHRDIKVSFGVGSGAVAGSGLSSYEWFIDPISMVGSDSFEMSCCTGYAQSTINLGYSLYTSGLSVFCNDFITFSDENGSQLVGTPMDSSNDYYENHPDVWSDDFYESYTHLIDESGNRCDFEHSVSNYRYVHGSGEMCPLVMQYSYWHLGGNDSLSSTSSSYPLTDLSVHDSNCTNNCDFGYFVSSSPLSLIGLSNVSSGNFYNIDTSKIPDDYIITVKGDTVYDYSITNPVTGDTTTIDKFVINNYNFPSGSNSGGNGTSGNVTVDGKINVSGTVSVDVNVDVNISGAGGGGGGNNYEMPDTGFFDDYLDDALDESSGIRKFISDFFNSVPGEITKLICIGLVLAILCRLIGR